MKYTRIYNFLNFIINTYPHRRYILILVDILIITISIITSFFLLNKNFDINYVIDNIQFIFLTILIILIIYISSSQYKGLTKYLGSKIIYKIIKKNLILISLLFILSYINFFSFPSNKELISIGIINILFTSISRFILRDTLLWIQFLKNSKMPKVLIYGAGSAGAQLAASLKISNSHIVSGFIDDSPNMWGRFLNDIPIYSLKESLKIQKKIDQVLLAIPSLDKFKRKKILNILKNKGFAVYQIPSFEELIRGNAFINDLQPISPEDLLGRDSVLPNNELLKASVENKIVCVTGAGGSIGGELCRQIINQVPKKLILIEISEASLYEISKSLKSEENNSIEIVSVLGNCKKLSTVENIFKTYEIDIVFHAAAYKHVVLVENNPLEGISNNIVSTLNICKSSLNHNIEKVVLISTDKAVRPTNVMGASKRLCELIVKYYSNKGKKNREKNTLFSIVRFGNVLGSSGSVVPLFNYQISKGGPITLTDENIIRYFMTISEAVQLVLQTASLSLGGEIFLLDMGKPMLIKELAERMIKLSGNTLKNKENKNGTIEIITTGLRPGEKLYEELLVEGNVINTIHKKIYISKETDLNDENFWGNITTLIKNIESNNKIESFKVLKKLVPEWSQSKLIKDN